MFSTPILLLLFNRPETTEKVFIEIRKLQPEFLYIAADGPRADHPFDGELCCRVRAIVTGVDWPCEVRTLFRDENAGCGAGPASAISWFFDYVDKGIILEDDCIPNHSFFSFCETLLEKYEEQSDVMMICGTSYQPRPFTRASYYFSKYPHVWGWATWKRAWTNYNFKLDGENEETRNEVIKKTFSNTRERRFWKNNFHMIINGLNTWDYQWMYWIWKNGGLCITPWENLISNIGFGPDATHTTDAKSKQSRMEQYELTAINHPEKVTLNKKADSYERYHILIEPAAKFHLGRLRRLFIRFFKPASKT